jgi:hypothetical protein
MELISEVLEKQRELGGSSVQVAIEALMVESASIWKNTQVLNFAGAVDYAVFWHGRFGRLSEQGKFFKRVVEALEHPDRESVNILALVKHVQGFADHRWKPIQLPSPKRARRLRIVVTEMPRYIGAPANRGPGKDWRLMWSLIWFDAAGYTAPQIAKMIGWPKILSRNRIWELRTATYRALERNILRQMNETSAAA